MKVIFSKSSRKRIRVRVTDRHRSMKLSKALIRASEKKSRQSLDKRGKHDTSAKKRERPAITVQFPEETKSKTKVRIDMPLSRAGNLRGMHNSGDAERMRKVRAMRKTYNKQMPVPVCNACAFSQNCPKYKAGFQCAFLPLLNSHGIDSPEDVMAYMQDMVASGMRRFQMASAMETLGGGAPSLELSESLMMMFNMARDLHDKMTDEDAGSVSIESDDDTLIGKLFGGMENLIGDTEEAVRSPIDNTPAALETERTGHLEDGFSTNDEINQEVADEISVEDLAKMRNRIRVRKGDNKKTCSDKIITGRLVKK